MLSRPDFIGHCHNAFGFLVHEFGYAIEESGRAPGHSVAVTYRRGEAAVRVALDLAAQVVDVDVNGRPLAAFVDERTAHDLRAAREEEWASELLIAAAALRRECSDVLSAT